MQHKDIFTIKSSSARYRIDTFLFQNYKFEIKITSVTYIRIGITTRLTNAKYLPLGSDKYSFSYSNRGYKYNNRIRQLYGEPYYAGDIITVEFGIIEQTSYVKFYKNGNDQGVAFYNVVNNGSCNVYAACSMYGDGEVDVNLGMYQVYCESGDDVLMKIWE